MKRFIITLLCLTTIGSAWAQGVSFDDLSRASQHLMKQKNPEAVLRGTDALVSGENRPVGYIFRFAPTGFIIASTSEWARPVYGYSFTNDFNLSDQEWRKIKAIFSRDLHQRIQQAGLLPASTKRAITREWEQFLFGRLLMSPFQQWPPEGSTPTGGWVITNWTQSAPYNSMCPMDLNAGARSVVGCPATAMGQIVNYHETLNSTIFNDGDDYYHSYGSGNQYWIDDDHEARSFPSWDSLNTWLNSMEYAYQTQLPITTEMKAALSFACGVAAHQVYTASVSGTFGIDQAWDSFQRFGFIDSRLIFPIDTNLNHDIAENIKVALPVQLGLLVEPPGSGGHNVVVDGYNTDEYYHFNFGWGGSSNGWYTLPPTNIAYNLTIIEGAVLDIKSANYTGTSEDPFHSVEVRIYPNPVSSILNITTTLEEAEMVLFSQKGIPLESFTLRNSHTSVSLSHLPSGLYLVLIRKEGKLIFSGKIIKV
ncbi:MAG: C10 family peptidase [Bacteroidales bacterium]|nr:C10 family peptidase [Bacteroidales bacterium]